MTKNKSTKATAAATRTGERSMVAQQQPRTSTRLTVFVPEADNAGQAFTPDAFAAFESFALDLAGGVTMGGHVKGLWRGEQTTYADTNREYILIVPRKRARAIALAVINYVKKQFRQLAVYVELTLVRVAGF